jgi:hypothetical protein
MHLGSLVWVSIAVITEVTARETVFLRPLIRSYLIRLSSNSVMVFTVNVDFVTMTMVIAELGS